MSEELKRSIPVSRVQVLPNVGHWSPIEAPGPSPPPSSSSCDRAAAQRPDDDHEHRQRRHRGQHPEAHRPPPATTPW
jgi:hypothetical protein